MRGARPLCLLAVIALSPLGGSAVLAVEPTSTNHRLVGAGPASVAASAASPLHDLVLVGASGKPVGISASMNSSVVSGGTSTVVRADRLFDNGFE